MATQSLNLAFNQEQVTMYLKISEAIKQQEEAKQQKLIEKERLRHQQIAQELKQRQQVKAGTLMGPPPPPFPKGPAVPLAPPPVANLFGSIAAASSTGGPQTTGQLMMEMAQSGVTMDIHEPADRAENGEPPSKTSRSAVS